jgi:hypothetical protein
MEGIDLSNAVEHEGKLYWYDREKECVVCGTVTHVAFEDLPPDVKERWEAIKKERRLEWE